MVYFILYNSINHWQNELLDKRILLNIELDEYMKNLGFIKYKGNEILELVNKINNIKNKCVDITKFNKIENILNSLKEINLIDVLDIHKSEKRYIILITNQFFLIIYYKKGINKDSEKIEFSRFSIHDTLLLDKKTFDKKITEMLNEIKNK